jgi:hypothetical protein
MPKGPTKRFVRNVIMFMSRIERIALSAATEQNLSRLALAIHEAAHAVAIIGLGLRPRTIEKVSIRRSKYAAGYVQATFDPHALARDRYKFARDHVTYRLASIPAQHQAVFIKKWDGTSRDRADARSIVRHFWPVEKRRNVYSQCLRSAARVVRRWWPAVMAVARALLRRQVLTGREVATTARRVMRRAGREEAFRLGA